MKKNYYTPEVEIIDVLVNTHIVAGSPQGEEIPVTGPTDDIEEVKENIWELD